MEKVNTHPADAHLSKAKALVEDAQYESAAKEYGAAAEIYEDALVPIYCAQAKALESADRFADAKVAAEAALRVAPSNAKAWYCKASALFKDGKRDLAKNAFERAASFESNYNLKMSYKDWAARCDEMADIDEGIDVIDVTGGAARTVPFTKDTASHAAEPEPEAPAQPKPPVDNTRMEWYQSATFVNIDIYAKNVITERSEVRIERTYVYVRLARPEKEDYVMEKSLFENVDVDGSTWVASRFKVEIRLKKANAGTVWKTLDSEAEVLSAALQAGKDSRRRREKQDARQQAWDAVADTELKDYKEDDGPMTLFRELYKDAPDEARRAMVKSYSESGGQVLSTNWEEVSKKKVQYEEKP